MRGIKGSAGYDTFEGYANAYSQNYGEASKDKRTIVLSNEDGDKKTFEVSAKLAADLKAQAAYEAEQEASRYED